MYSRAHKSAYSLSIESMVTLEESAMGEANHLVSNDVCIHSLVAMPNRKHQLHKVVGGGSIEHNDPYADFRARTVCASSSSNAR